jgi:hypothetical protein
MIADDPTYRYYLALSFLKSHRVVREEDLDKVHQLFEEAKEQRALLQESALSIDPEGKN